MKTHTNCTKDNIIIEDLSKDCRYFARELLFHKAIKSGKYEDVDDLYCKYGFLMGNQWKVVQGVDTGTCLIDRCGGFQ